MSWDVWGKTVLQQFCRLQSISVSSLLHHSGCTDASTLKHAAVPLNNPNFDDVTEKKKRW